MKRTILVVAACAILMTPAAAVTKDDAVETLLSVLTAVNACDNLNLKSEALQPFMATHGLERTDMLRLDIQSKVSEQHRVLRTTMGHDSYCNFAYGSFDSMISKD